jgi:hypothetical protein
VWGGRGAVVLVLDGGGAELSWSGGAAADEVVAGRAVEVVWSAEVLASAVARLLRCEVDPDFWTTS